MNQTEQRLLPVEIQKWFMEEKAARDKLAGNMDEILDEVRKELPSRPRNDLASPQGETPARN